MVRGTYVYMLVWLDLVHFYSNIVTLDVTATDAFHSFFPFIAVFTIVKRGPAYLPGIVVVSIMYYFFFARSLLFSLALIESDSFVHYVQRL